MVGGRIPVIGYRGTHDGSHQPDAAKEVGQMLHYWYLITISLPRRGFTCIKAVAEAVDIPQVLYNVPGRRLATCSLKL